jgi:hypothetical protein
MPLTKLENELRGKARERIQQGALPGVRPNELLGGGGTNVQCSLCDEKITPDATECEIEVRTAGAARKYHFHGFCYALWQLECSRAEHLRSQPQA